MLQIRAKVLSTIACDTELVYSEQQAREQLGTDHPKAELLILCHTGEEEVTDRLRSIALTAGIPTYTVEKLVPPQQLVDDVSRVLRRGKAPQKAVKARP